MIDINVGFAGEYNIPIIDAPWLGLNSANAGDVNPNYPGMANFALSFGGQFMMLGSSPYTNINGGCLFVDSGGNIKGFILCVLDGSKIKYYVSETGLNMYSPPAGLTAFQGGIYMLRDKGVFTYQNTLSQHVVIFFDINNSLLIYNDAISSTYILNTSNQYTYTNYTSNNVPVRTNTPSATFTLSDYNGTIFLFSVQYGSDGLAYVLRYFIEDESMIRLYQSTIPYYNTTGILFITPGVNYGAKNLYAPFKVEPFFGQSLMTDINLLFPSNVSFSGISTSTSYTMNGKYYVMYDNSFREPNKFRYLVLDLSFKYCFYIILDLVTANGKQYYINSAEIPQNSLNVVGNTVVFAGIQPNAYKYPGTNFYYNWHGIGGIPFPSFPPPPSDPFSNVKNFTPNGHLRYPYPSFQVIRGR